MWIKWIFIPKRVTRYHIGSYWQLLLQLCNRAFGFGQLAGKFLESEKKTRMHQTIHQRKCVLLENMSHVLNTRNWEKETIGNFFCIFLTLHDFFSDLRLPAAIPGPIEMICLRSSKSWQSTLRFWKTRVKSFIKWLFLVAHVISWTRFFPHYF